MNTILLNPFSVQLSKHPFMDIKSKPMYIDGNFKIYKYYDRHYIHTYKNIVVTELGAPNREILTQLKNKVAPIDSPENSDLFSYNRCVEAMELGIKEAKKLNFTIQ